MGTRCRSQFIHSATYSSCSDPLLGASVVANKPKLKTTAATTTTVPSAALFNELPSDFDFDLDSDSNLAGNVAVAAAAMSGRPAIYVHFEFGVSWTPRDAPRNHQVTYMSKSMRDRANQFPRQLPPANTNFLAAEPSPAQAPLHDQHGPYQPYSPYQPIDATPALFSPPVQPMPHQYLQPTDSPRNCDEPSHEPRRSSRSQSRSSHGRGRSAPPPFNDSPWDAEPEPMMASALPRSSPRPQLWKALPATPNHFRLGEDDMPWASTSFPLGYGEDDRTEGQTRTGSASTIAESSPRAVDDHDRGRTREMQSLATAMMTVDNGFEDQWWYQGPRLVNVAGQLMSPSALAETTPQDGTVGWAIAEDERALRNQREPLRVHTPQSSVVDIVSPISDFSSPVSSYQGLRRSLTTRSDELHIY